MDIDFFKSISNIGEVLAIIALISSFCAWLYKVVWLKRVTVKRIREKTDDLYDAFKIYLSRFKDISVLDNSEDMANWLTQINELNKSNETKWDIFLYIVKTGREVIGFFYAEYHKIKRLLLISYIAAKKGKGNKQNVTEKIVKRLKRELRSKLRDCKGIIFELELRSNKEKRNSRFHLFERTAKKFGIELKRLDINYIQPNINPWDLKYSEKEQIIVYGHTNNQSIGNTISKAEYINILDTLYNEWYVSAYEDSPEYYDEYKQYIKNLFEKAVSSLPENIKTY